MIKMRSVTRADLDELANMFVACFNAPPWNEGWPFCAARERLELHLDSRHAMGTLASWQGRSVGMLLGQRQRWVEGFHFELQELCVLPEHQRRGVGRALVQHVTAELRREGTFKVYLLTGPGTPAEAFYASCGFYKSRARIVMAASLSDP